MSNPLQQTHEWFEARCGCLTASRAADVIKRQKNGKPYAAYEQMMDTIITERVTGEIQGVPATAAMQWGVDHEDAAREQYEIMTGNSVDLCGFILHPEIDFFGASPDGLVGDDGLLEIKCPNSGTHIRRYRAGTVPEEYKPQMLVQLLCTGRKWVDFVDYDPRIVPEFEKARFFCVRYEPTDEELQDAKEKCCEFLDAVAQEMRRFQKMVEGV